MHHQALKQELKTTQKVLQQEIGPEHDIQSIIKGESSWKGRAELIVVLKAKIKELTQRLSNQERHTDLEQRNRHSIHKIENSKRIEYEKAMLDLEMARHDNTELKRKCDALAARNTYITYCSFFFFSTFQKKVSDVHEM